MKKIILILIIGIASLSIIFAYNKKLYKKILSAQYILYTKDYRTHVMEFTPDGNPNYICVVTSGGRGISCIPKGK